MTGPCDQETGKCSSCRNDTLSKSVCVRVCVSVSLNFTSSSSYLRAAGNKVPASLLEKAGRLRDEGGVGVINKLMSDLPELLNRNREILDVVRSSVNVLWTQSTFSVVAK